MNDQQIISTISRALWVRRLLVAFVIDAVFCYAIAYMVSNEWNRPEWWYSIAGVPILWLVQAVLGGKNWLSSLLAIKVFETPLYVDLFLQVLRANKLSSPYMAQPKRFDYLSDLASSEYADVEERVKAAMIYGTWSGIMQARGFATTLELTRSLDEAVRRYALEMPSSKYGA